MQDEGSDIEKRSNAEVDFQVPEDDHEEKDLGVPDEEHDMFQKTGESKAEIEIETGAIIDQIAMDTYERDSVAIRELLANAEATCLEAAEKLDDSYSPVVEVQYQEGGELRFYDNGMGITTAVFDEVLRHIKRTTNADKGSVSGQKGMGVYSIRNIIEEDAGCVITSHARESDENYAEYMTPREFHHINGSLPEEVYGTEFTIPVKDGFGSTKIRDAIEKYAEFLRVPVIYTHYDGDGNEEFQEDYGQNTLESQYPDDSMVITYEDEYVKAVATQRSNEKTLLCSMPIGRNDGGTRGYHNSGTYKRSSVFKWDLKIKREDGVEWEDGIHLPTPTSDRDRLSSDDDGEFFQRVSEKLKDEFFNAIAESFKKLDSPEDLLSLPYKDERAFENVMTGLDRTSSRYKRNVDKLVDRLDDKMGVDISDEVAEVLIKIEDNVELAERGTSYTTADGRDNIKIADILRNQTEDSDVYMGKTITNRKKPETVWALNNYNTVVRLGKGETYEEYQRLFGWKILKEIDVSEYEDELSEDMVERLDAYSNAGKPPEERNITVRRGTKGLTRNVGEVAEKLTVAHEKEDARGIKLSYSTYSDELILFPPSAEEGVSDWYDFSKETGIACAKVDTKMVYEYLIENTPNTSTMNIDEIVSEAKEIELTTTEGIKKMGEIQDRLVIHTIKEEEVLTRAKKPQIQKNIQEVLRELDTSDDDLLYVPVEHARGMMFKAGINDMKIDVIDFHGGYDFNYGFNEGRFKTDVEIYAAGRFDKWEVDSPEMKFVLNGAQSEETESVLNIVDMLVQFHDAGVSPISKEPGDVDLSINGYQSTMPAKGGV